LRLVYECADGYVVLFPIGGALSALLRWCVQDGLIPEAWLDDEDWPTYHIRLIQGEPVSHTLDEVLDPIDRYVLGKTKNQLLEKSLREGVSMAPVSTIQELTRFQQLEERAYWLTAPLPNGQEVQAPGLFARLSEMPMKVRRWAPRLGEHNDEVLGGVLGYSTAEIAKACGSAGN
jgi:formyl-CoA transferase